MAALSWKKKKRLSSVLCNDTIKDLWVSIKVYKALGSWEPIDDSWYIKNSWYNKTSFHWRHTNRNNTWSEWTRTQHGQGGTGSQLPKKPCQRYSNPVLLCVLNELSKAHTRLVKDFKVRKQKHVLKAAGVRLTGIAHQN